MIDLAGSQQYLNIRGWGNFLARPREPPAPPLPLDLVRILVNACGSHWLHIQLPSNASFLVGFERCKDYTGWLNKWGESFTLSPDSKEGTQDLEVELAADSKYQITDRVAGFRCRQILDISVNRWKDFGISGRKAELQGTTDAIERAIHIVKWIRQYGSHYMPFHEGRKARIMRMSHRLWYHHELCLLASELRLRYLFSHTPLREIYQREELPWQVCWVASRGIKDMIGKIWDPVPSPKVTEVSTESEPVSDDDLQTESDSEGL